MWRVSRSEEGWLEGNERMEQKASAVRLGGWRETHLTKQAKAPSRSQVVKGWWKELSHNFRSHYYFQRHDSSSCFQSWGYERPHPAASLPQPENVFPLLFLMLIKSGQPLPRSYGCHGLTLNFVVYSLHQDTRTFPSRAQAMRHAGL